MEDFLKVHGRFKNMDEAGTETAIFNLSGGMVRLEGESLVEYRDRARNAGQGTPQQSVAGLPVAGYKPTQSPKAIAAVNVFKELEERALRHADALLDAHVDGRWLAIGRTQLQQAFMSLNRAIFQPGRVTLPEDMTGLNATGDLGTE